MMYSSYDSGTPEHADPATTRAPSAAAPWRTGCSEGEEFAVTFGGQGTDWFATLAELLEEEPATPPGSAELVEESGRRLVSPSPERSPRHCRAPSSRSSGSPPRSVPAAAELTNAAWACPACCSPS